MHCKFRECPLAPVRSRVFRTLWAEKGRPAWAVPYGHCYRLHGNVPYTPESVQDKSFPPYGEWSELCVRVLR